VVVRAYIASFGNNMATAPITPIIAKERYVQVPPLTSTHYAFFSSFPEKTMLRVGRKKKINLRGQRERTETKGGLYSADFGASCREASRPIRRAANWKARMQVAIPKSMY